MLWLSPRMRGCFHSSSALGTRTWLSPRMRGCFLEELGFVAPEEAFPAYAGMFPSLFKKFLNSLGFPRVCGDVSIVRKSLSSYSLLSPRMRGCFHDKTLLAYKKKAFPAYAGMFPAITRSTGGLSCFPRVCGDVSMLLGGGSSLLGLSPRMRGCF